MYVDKTKVPTLRNGEQALLSVVGFARQVGAVVPDASMAFKDVPLIAPEHGEAALQLDGSIGAVSIFLNAAAYVANGASSIAKTVDNALPFWFML